MTDGTIKVDTDINLEHFSSKIMKRLVDEYDSIYGGSVDRAAPDIHFFTNSNKAWFTFHDSQNEVRVDITRLGGTRECLSGMEEFMIFIPWLQAIYTCRNYRGQGIQSEIIKKIIDISEDTGEIWGAVADPFKPKAGVLGINAKDCFRAFHKHGYRRPDDWDSQVVAQCQRFKKYGMQNYELLDYSLTKPFQHWVYIPSTAKPDHRKIVESNLKVSEVIVSASG